MLLIPIIFKKELSEQQEIFVSIYTTIEYCFFAIFLFFAIQSKKLRTAIVLLSIGFIIFQIIYFFTGSFVRLDSIPVGVETILLLVFVFFLFYENFRTPRIGFIYNHYSFWIAVGIMIYLGGSFFFNILIDHLKDSKQVRMYLKLTYIPEFIKNIFFVIAMIIYSRNPIEKTRSTGSSVPYLDMI